MNSIIKKNKKNLVAVTIGDIKGIGIFFLIKEYKKKNIDNFVLITNLEIFINNIHLRFKIFLC